ncbi:MAG TPA: hypothetical protein PKA50_14265 [Gemmatimonadales bacterium]|nr:hypothetical protein [Gemmatimonadales bacterium]
MSPRARAAGLIASALLAVTAPRAVRAQDGPGSGWVAGRVYLPSERGERPATGVGMILLVRDTDLLRTSLDAVCLAQRLGAAAVGDSLARLQREVGDTMQTPVGDPWTSWWEAETDIRGARMESRIHLASRSRAAIRRLLGAAAVDSAQAGSDAGYRFDGVAAGRYVLYAEWSGGPATYQAWQPLRLAARVALMQHLRGAGEPTDQFSCRFP